MLCNRFSLPLHSFWTPPLAPARVLPALSGLAGRRCRAAFRGAACWSPPARDMQC